MKSENPMKALQMALHKQDPITSAFDVYKRQNDSINSAFNLYKKNLNIGLPSAMDGIIRHEKRMKQLGMAFNQQLTPLQDLSRSIHKAFGPVVKSLSQNQKVFSALGPVIGSFSQNQKALGTNMALNLNSAIKLQQSIAFKFDPIFESQRKMHKSFNKHFKWQIGNSLKSQSNSIALNMDYSRVNQLFSSFGSILNQPDMEITSIDFTGVDELRLIENLEENSINEGSTDLSASITISRPKKKLVDMTSDDLENLVKKCITPAKKFSVIAFIYSLYSDYVNEAARLIIEIMLVVSISIVTGHFDSNVKAAIKERVEESMTVNDLRKVITRYVKVNPYGHLGFLRKDSYIREGASKRARVLSTTQITTMTPLSIVGRRNNWLKVEIDDGEYQGEIGWVEESKVTKYKRVD